MTTVDITFGQLWLTPVSDLSAGAGFELHALEHDPKVAVATRQYAGGNFRMIVTPGRQKTAKVTLGWCTDDQVAQLKLWQGVLLCFRDPMGEKFFGFYDDSSFAPRQMGNSWSVPFTVQQVTYSEAVT